MNGTYFDSQNAGLAAETFSVTLTSGSATTLPTRTDAARRVPYGVVIAEAVFGDRVLTNLAWAWSSSTGGLTVTPTLDSAGSFDAVVVVLYKA